MDMERVDHWFNFLSRFPRSCLPESDCIVYIELFQIKSKGNEVENIVRLFQPLAVSRILRLAVVGKLQMECLSLKFFSVIIFTTKLYPILKKLMIDQENIYVFIYMSLMEKN